MPGGLNLSREQLAAFLPDHQAVKAFEQLFKTAELTLPSEIAILYSLVEGIEISEGLANSKANGALAELSSIAKSLELLASRPPVLDLSVVERRLLDLESSPIPSTDANVPDIFPWTPVLSSSGGVITTLGAASGTFRKRGRVRTAHCVARITTNGTGSGTLKITGLPFTADTTYPIVGIETTGVGVGLSGYISGSTIFFWNYAGAYIGADNATYWITVQFLE